MRYAETSPPGLLVHSSRRAEFAGVFRVQHNERVVGLVNRLVNWLVNSAGSLFEPRRESGGPRERTDNLSGSSHRRTWVGRVLAGMRRFRLESGRSRCAGHDNSRLGSQPDGR
jgi:hypothetical protein